MKYKQILKALKRLNERRPSSAFHYVRIFCDGSGSVRDRQDLGFEFGDIPVGSKVRDIVEVINAIPDEITDAQPAQEWT